MKRMIQALILTLVMALASVTFAAQAERIEEGADITGIKKLAICLPDYYKSIDEEPTYEELVKALGEAGKKAKVFEVISYNDLAREIKADTAIDIRVLPRPESKKIYKEYVGRYADAYLFVTIANNSRVNFFGDVYKSGTNELLYTLQLAGGKENSYKTVKNYKTLAEKFYETFGAAINLQIKKARDGDDDD